MWFSWRDEGSRGSQENIAARNLQHLCPNTCAHQGTHSTTAGRMASSPKQPWCGTRAISLWDQSSLPKPMVLRAPTYLTMGFLGLLPSRQSKLGGRMGSRSRKVHVTALKLLHLAPYNRNVLKLRLLKYTTFTSVRKKIHTRVRLTILYFSDTTGDAGLHQANSCKVNDWT